LPKLYRIVVAVTAVGLCAGAGAWLAFRIPYPLLVSAGASIGLAVGVVCAYMLLHRSQSAAEPERLRRHRLQ